MLVLEPLVLVRQVLEQQVLVLAQVLVLVLKRLMVLRALVLVQLRAAWALVWALAVVFDLV